VYFKSYRPIDFNLNFKIKIVCKQYGIPLCAPSLNAPCLYIKNRPEDASLEPKHVVNYVLMIIYMYVLFY
jgi:hypothetical protein